MKDFKYDIAIRTWIVGAVIGYMASSLGWFDLNSEAAGFVGAVIGAVYDFVAFMVKQFLKGDKE